MNNTNISTINSVPNYSLPHIILYVGGIVIIILEVIFILIYRHYRH